MTRKLITVYRIGSKFISDFQCWLGSYSSICPLHHKPWGSPHELYMCLARAVLGYGLENWRTWVWLPSGAEILLFSTASRPVLEPTQHNTIMCSAAAMQRSREGTWRCLVAAGKHVNDIWAITRQPPITTISKNCWRWCFLLGLPRGHIARTPGQLSAVQLRVHSSAELCNGGWEEMALYELSVESQPVKRRLGGWYEMAASLGVSELSVELFKRGWEEMAL
jgi:hypothetical protein